ncbi:MAG: ABC transporter permease [Candidatus Sulfopaludibacter sp.]|nr:ABC transporter permease [Candidatus Sulfopaludibacter sp.]
MWRRLFRKPSEADLAEELEAHLAIETKQWMDRGLPRDRAEMEARRLFGSRALTLEATREVRGIAAFGRFSQDLRYAARVLQRGRAFTIAAVLSLALGIGATTAVFSIYDTIFLRPLPYKDPAQLTWISIHSPSMGIDLVPSPNYVAWRRDNKTFQQLAATQVTFSNMMVLGGSNPAEVYAGRVSANFFETFGVTPAAGRTFRPEDELQGPQAAMLTDRFWREHFGARHDVLGTTLTLDGYPFTIVGILPKSFVYPVDVKVDVLFTLAISPTASLRDRSVSAFSVFGRIQPGVTVSQARADLGTQFETARKDFPGFFRGNSLVLESLRDYRTGNVGKFLYLLMAAAACLLAIACANVANLLLARWGARARELAVRAAIGAGRGRLARQLFTEVALLIAAGTALAMLFVTAALRGFVHFAGTELPRLSEVATDFRVFGIAVAVALLTAALFGALPALRAGRIDPQAVLQQAGRTGVSGGHSFLRRALVTLEVALSVILLSCASLLFETLWHMQNDHLGFQPEHVLTVSIPLRGKSFDTPARQAVASDILAYLRRIPGTESASLADCSPISAGVKSFTFSRADRPLPESFGLSRTLGACDSDAEYLQAAGIRLVQGRFLTDEDRHHPGAVAVLNEAAARAFFPGESPLGKQILGGRAGGWRTVVGVVADTKNQGLNRPAAPEVFLDDSAPSGFADLNFVVRTLAREGALAGALREEMRRSHPGLLTKVETLDQAIGQLTASPRFDTVLLAAFAAIAFLMAIVGVYGVLAFSVTQRRAEIGIRMALGASPRAVLAMVMREGTILVTLGALSGIAAALFLTRYLATLLYGVRGTDPATYAIVTGTLALAAAAASFLPARRAAIVDPALTLRHE